MMSTLSRDTALCTADKRYVPRGIRNNNPLNIRKGSKWQGLRDFPTDKEFCEFVTMAYGFRAAFRTLITYYTKHKCKTLKEIITRWAPPSENETWAYIDRVRKDADIEDIDSELPDPLEKRNWYVWKKIILAMAAVENGASMKRISNYNKTVLEGMNMVFG